MSGNITPVNARKLSEVRKEAKLKKQEKRAVVSDEPNPQSWDTVKDIIADFEIMAGGILNGLQRFNIIAQARQNQEMLDSIKLVAETTSAMSKEFMVYRDDYSAFDGPVKPGEYGIFSKAMNLAMTDYIPQTEALLEGITGLSEHVEAEYAKYQEEKGAAPLTPTADLEKGNVE